MYPKKKILSGADVYSILEPLVAANHVKDGQISKVHTSSHEITIGPYMGSNYENIVKTMTIDLLKNIL